MAMTELNADSFLDSTSWEASEFAWDPRKLVAAPAAGAAHQPYIKQPLQVPMASGGSGSEVSETGLNAQAPSPSGGITPTSPPVLVRRCQPKMGPPSSAAQNMCRVQGCAKSLNGEKAYYKRYSICEEHLRSLSLMVDGTLSRFCFQCGKFEGLENFEGDKRSCRTQLQEHNKRRRKGGVLRRQSRRGRKAATSSPIKAPKRRSARLGDDDDTDMTGTDTHMLWAGQQRTLAAAKEQVVAPLPVGPVVGLHMEDLVGPGSMSGRSSDYASTEACLPQEPSVQASAFAGGSAFMGRRSSLGRAMPGAMRRMPSAVDPFEEALSKFALESGCGGLGDVDVACGMTRTQSRDTALWMANSQPVVSLPEAPPLVAQYPGSNTQPGGMDIAHFLQPRNSSTELVERVLNGASSGPASLTEGVFTGESFTGGRPNPAELQRGSMWQASAALLNENWQGQQPLAAHQQQQQQQELKAPLLQPFLSEPPPLRQQAQQRPLMPQNSGPALNSPFTSLACAPLQPPAPANNAPLHVMGSMGPPASTTPGGLGAMGGMGSLSFACSLQRALSGGSLQRALSGSLFSLPSLPLESLLGRGDSLLPPVAPLPATKSEPADSFAAAQRLSAGFGAGAVRYTPSELNIRLAMKLPNCTPDQLPPDMHAALGRALAAGDMTLMQGFLRPGCVQLVVDVRKRLAIAEGATPDAIEQELTGASARAIADMGWAPLIQMFANSSGSSTRRAALMQLGDEGAIVDNGRLQRTWKGESAAGAPELMWAGPCCIVSEPGCAVVVAGNGLRTEGLKMFARSQGVFLSTTASPAVPTRAGEAHLPDSSLLLQLEAPPTSGLAFVEFEHCKVLSRAVPLLLVDDAHMAMEISDSLDGAVRFGSAADRLMAEQLLIDLGLLLEYHASWEKLSLAGDASVLPEMVAPVQAAPAAESSSAETAALSPMGSDLARALQQRRLQSTAAAMRAVRGAGAGNGGSQKAPVEEARAEMVSLGCRLLEHCCDRGWQHTCGRIVTVLLALGCSFAEVVAATAGPDGLSLLHRAVRAGSAAMVSAVLALGEQQWYKWEWQTPGPWGLTPLHLAASVADNGQLAELLLNKHPDACQVWLSAAAVDGQTPAQHASKLGLDHLNQIAQLGTTGALVRSTHSSDIPRAKLATGDQDPCAVYDSSNSFVSGSSTLLSSSAGNSGGALARAAGRADDMWAMPALVEDLQPAKETVAAAEAKAAVPAAEAQSAADAVAHKMDGKSRAAPAAQRSAGCHMLAAVIMVLLASAVFQLLEALNCSPWCICKSICLLAWALVPSLLLSSTAKQQAQGALSRVLQGPGDCASVLCSLVQDHGPVRLQTAQPSIDDTVDVKCA